MCPIETLGRLACEKWLEIRDIPVYQAYSDFVQRIKDQFRVEVDVFGSQVNYGNYGKRFALLCSDVDLLIKPTDLEVKGEEFISFVKAMPTCNNITKKKKFSNVLEAFMMFNKKTVKVDMVFAELNTTERPFVSEFREACPKLYAALSTFVPQTEVVHLGLKNLFEKPVGSVLDFSITAQTILKDELAHLSEVEIMCGNFIKLLRHNSFRFDSVTVWLLCCGARKGQRKIKIRSKQLSENGGMQFVRFFLSEVANLVQIIDNDDDKYLHHFFWTQNPKTSALPIYLLTRTQINMIKNHISVCMQTFLTAPTQEFFKVKTVQDPSFSKRKSEKWVEYDVTDTYAHYTHVEEHNASIFVFLTPFMHKIFRVFGNYDPVKPYQVYYEKKKGGKVPPLIGYEMVCMSRVQAHPKHAGAITAGLLDTVINMVFAYFRYRIPIANPCPVNPISRQVLLLQFKDMDEKLHYLVPESLRSIAGL